MKELLNYLKKPEVYAPSSSKFWDDEHISKGMLEAHLTPDLEAASREHHVIDQSVNWISTIAPQKTHPNVLDLGCGPGLYADRFNQLGYKVTGVDFSKRSINYAKKHNSNNEYIYQNYLNINYENQFDLVILIYCDYAVLSPSDRHILLNKIYQALKPGGIFIFDVFTIHNYKDEKNRKTWIEEQNSGFWKPTPYVELFAHYLYDNEIQVDQYIIIDENGKIDNYLVWNQGYTKETILKELDGIGFNSIDFYGDCTGTPLHDESKTMCMVVYK